MRKIKQHPDLAPFIYDCSAFISQQQQALKRTNSQVPATGRIWYWQVDLKQILSPKQFVTWFTDKFAPAYEDALSGENKHLTRIYKDFANFIIDKMSTSKVFTEENLEDVKSAIIKDEADLPPTQPLGDEFEEEEDSLTPPLDYGNLKASL